MTAAATTRPLRILIADDHELFAEGLAAILDAHAGLEVVGRAADGAEALALASTLRPDVILMDVNMPSLDGISATREIVASGAETRVLMVSASTGADVVSRARAAGAAAYLFKGCPLRDMLAAIRETVPASSLAVQAA
jgi:DNA-binding NarL/FixJ family response regulator